MRLRYPITRADVESVHTQIKSEIVTRLTWNLRLDPRFQAIAWTLPLSHQVASADLVATVDDISALFWDGSVGVLSASALLDETQRAWPVEFTQVHPR